MGEGQVVDVPPRTTLSDGTQVYPEHRRIIEGGPRAGQQEGYVVLAEEERAKGFVRPVRRSYRHVGPPGPAHPLRDLTDDEKARYAKYGYVKYERYPRDPSSSVLGRFWTQEQIDKVGKGCGSVTTMGQALAETYARDPSFYGATFCSHYGAHFPVGSQGEFVWEGTNERVGTWPRTSLRFDA